MSSISQSIPFFGRLNRISRERNSLLCVGLDPHPEQLPALTASHALSYCLRLIDACAPYACAFKPNSAFFESLGPEGLAALERVIASVPDDIPVILDAKRGDIASTAKAYRVAVFDRMGASAVTMSPYLGFDSMMPFLADPERGIFVLCKTSNPGAGEFQSLKLESGEPLYLRVAQQACSWSEFDNVGLVVGATDPEALGVIRTANPDQWFLSPGVGAQGGSLESALEAGLRQDGMGVLVAVSRSIANADDPAMAASQLQQEINEIRDRLSLDRSRAKDSMVNLAPQPQSRNPRSSATMVNQVATALVESDCVRFGRFTLKSGKESPIYLDLRRLSSHPPSLQAVARAFAAVLAELDFDRLAAIPYGALPIGTAVSLLGEWPMIYPRREAKDYGTRSVVEGAYKKGETVVVVDDLVTTGESKLEAIEKLKSAGLHVRDIVVLINRGNRSTQLLASAGYRLHALVTLEDLLPQWREAGLMTDGQYLDVLEYLEGD